jgi:DUF971 family protein
MLTPTNIQLIGHELAIAWSDGQESYIGFERLRAASPSAENQGERDILGVRHGGHDGTARFDGVELLGWHPVGNYALRLAFSDGHSSGLYSYALLRQLGAQSP